MLVVTRGVRLVACHTLFGDVIFLRFGVLLVFFLGAFVRRLVLEMMLLGARKGSFGSLKLSFGGRDFFTQCPPS